MSIRYPAGFIRIGYDPLKVPNAPTIGTATAGDTQASVTFTAPSNVGGSAISSYTAVSTPSGISASGASSPITVTGLTNGTAYTFAVWALNTYGPSAYSAASGSVTPVGVYAVWAGGNISGGLSNVIDYVMMSTLGNATDFGDISISGGLASCAGGFGNSTRGIFGFCSSSDYQMQFITYSSAGNSSNFGSFNVSEYRVQGAACNSATRGVVAAGQATVSFSNAISYVTIANTGNTTDFGDLSTGRRQVPAGLSSSTRGLFAGGEINSGNPEIDAATASIEYITIASTGNSSSFGSLSQTVSFVGGASNSTRGIFKLGVNINNGYTQNNILEYVTIATTGATTDFGDYSMSTYGVAGGANTTRAIFGMGNNGYKNNIEYVTIATTGNSTDFGDLTVARNAGGCVSSANGGLQ